jgi:hypothetical protein
MQHISQRKLNVVQTKFFRSHTHFGPAGPTWKTCDTGGNY